MAFMDGLSGMNGNLLSIGSNKNNENYDGGLTDFANQVLQLHRDELRRRNQINDAMLQHQLTPINPYAAPLTTNNVVSHGLTGANTDMNTVSASPNLDASKLNLAKQKEQDLNTREANKLDFNKSKSENELGFKQSNAEEQNKIKQQRADVYEYKSKHPDHKFDFSGSTVKVADPSSGAVYDTGLPTDKLSMEDKMMLANQLGTQRDTSRIINSNEQGMRRDANRSANTIGEIQERGNQTRETNLVKPNTKSVSNSQINQGYINKAQELLNTNPQYAPYIKLGKSDNGKVNGFSINPINGPDDPLYHEVNAKIYGNDMGDVSIPSNDSSKSNKTDKNKTNDTKKLDPLGIR